MAITASYDHGVDLIAAEPFVARHASVTYLQKSPTVLFLAELFDTTPDRVAADVYAVVLRERALAHAG